MIMRYSVRLAVLILVLPLLQGCAPDEVNPTFQAVCEAVCRRASECFPNGTVSECVSACLTGVGNPPCERNQAALDACVAAFETLSCADLAAAAVPTECVYVCLGDELCEGVECDDRNECMA